MKSLLLFFVLSFLVSCNSETSKTVVSEQIENKTTNDKENIPTFKNSSVVEYVKEYNEYIREYISALENNNKSKIEQLKKQGVELIEKAKVISTELKIPEEIEKFKKWLEIQNRKIKNTDFITPQK